MSSIFTEPTPTFEMIFNLKQTETSVFRQVVDRVHQQLPNAPWVSHLNGYLISVLGISPITGEVYMAIKVHYAAFNWEVSIEADRLLFTPHIQYGVKA